MHIFGTYSITSLHLHIKKQHKKDFWKDLCVCVCVDIYCYHLSPLFNIWPVTQLKTETLLAGCGSTRIKLVYVRCWCWQCKQQACWLRHNHALETNHETHSFVPSLVIAKGLFLLKGAYWEPLDTFPSKVCFLISIVAWKLPWSLFGFLYGIYRSASNQVFSFC